MQSGIGSGNKVDRPNLPSVPMYGADSPSLSQWLRGNGAVYLSLKAKEGR